MSKRIDLDEAKSTCEDDEARDDEPDYDDDPDADPEGCRLGASCLNPHPYHLAYECFDLEMAEATMGGDGATEGQP